MNQSNHKRISAKLKLTFLMICLLCLSDTIVYAQIAEQSQKFSHDKKMNLIRSLVKKRIFSDSLLKQRYEKENVPILIEIL
jgi:hypothetical protein